MGRPRSPTHPPPAHPSHLRVQETAKWRQISGEKTQKTFFIIFHQVFGFRGNKKHHGWIRRSTAVRTVSNSRWSDRIFSSVFEFCSIREDPRPPNHDFEICKFCFFSIFPNHSIGVFPKDTNVQNDGNGEFIIILSLIRESNSGNRMRKEIFFRENFGDNPIYCPAAIRNVCDPLCWTS